MSNELMATLQSQGALTTVDEKGFKELSGSGGFLPRIQLFGGSSKLAKQGKIGIGRWGLVKGKDEVTDLTSEVEVLVLAMRARATEIDKDGNIINIFDQANPEFKVIAGKSEQPDSGCMFGPEFLVYVPSLDAFAGYFMSSKTARNEATNVRDLIGKGATLKSELIETKKYSWHGPKVTACSNPLTEPDLEQVKVQVQAFLNPPKVETVAAETERPR